MRSSASTPSAVVIPRRSAASAGDSVWRRGLALGEAAAGGRDLAAPCHVMSDRWPTNRCARTRSASTPTSRQALQLMLRVRPGTRRLRACASRSRAMVAAVYSTWPGRPSNALTDEKSTNSSGGAAENGASEKTFVEHECGLEVGLENGRFERTVAQGDDLLLQRPRGMEDSVDGAETGMDLGECPPHGLAVANIRDERQHVGAVRAQALNRRKRRRARSPNPSWRDQGRRSVGRQLASRR